jgi:putative membrane protein
VSRKSKAYTAAMLSLMLIPALGSCNKDRQNADVPSTAMDSTTSPSTESAAAPTGGLSDANIVALLDEANAADSASGAYAVGKATNPDVKAFAKLMMGEHHALRAQGQQLAARLNVKPEPVADDPFKAAVQSEMAALRATPKGAQFDRTYIEHEIGIHKAVLDVAGKAHDAAQNEELKKLIEQAGPVIQKHLDRAQEIQKKLGKPTA